ncbi:Pseudouridylate synthase 1 [Giardia muris]|uniref:tRNA pseudouridine synthase n=1 Tax=Giardia muris TaxID=5742 RepID=A0A4Z1SS16_GIAMU|nr:Pseudouridylate synthase 1 [Giardia muris]|eukprot:TNJ28674.1 Pseudouridylate synthase 1 [Giardia muris]
MSRRQFIHTALAVGYVGTTYFGSQFQVNVKTVEGTIYEALEASGLLEGREVKTIGWTRCSRTDRYVSASMAIYSCYLRAGLDITEILNAKLPDSIRVYKHLRVPPKFNAKTMCIGRAYEYVAPLELFWPKPFVKEVKNDPSESYLNHVRELMPSITELFVARKHDLEKFLVMDSEVLRTIKEISLIPPSIEVFNTRLRPLLNGLADRAFLTSVRAYHNFTDEAIRPSAASRKITLLTISEAWPEKTGIYVRVDVVGQAFLLWQIRRMIGTLIGVIQGILPFSYIYFAFQPTVTNLKLPTAPGNFLLLKRPQYSHLLNRTDYKQYGTFLSEDEDVQRMSDTFKASQIYPQIYSLAYNDILNEFFDGLLTSERRTWFWSHASTLLEKDVLIHRTIAERTVVIPSPNQ